MEDDDVADDTLMKIADIVNRPGLTWRERRILLYAMGVGESLAVQLIPAPPAGMDFHPGDY